MMYFELNRGLSACVVASFLAALATPLLAAPDAASLNAARAEVRELLADDFRELNAGRRALVDVADRVADLASASNSAARSRVLQEGAFNMYREAGDLNRSAERHVPFWINLGTEAEFEFAACPAGSFTMGFEGDIRCESFRHKVNFPRPFWMARLQTTKRLLDTFRKVAELKDEERLYGGMDIPAGGLSREEMDAFCAFLTRRNKDRIPAGYIFRLPTDAEWEYALNANCEDPGDPYVRFRNGDRSVVDEISITTVFVNRLRAEHGQPPIKSGQGPVFKVGTRRPNAWGLFDMLSNGGEALLDTIPNVIERPWGEGVFDVPFDFGYEDEMTEPVRYSSATNRIGLMRGSARYKRFAAQWYGRQVMSCERHWNGNFVFRVVLAPDILSERGLGGVE